MTEEQNTEPSAYPIGARVCAELAGSFLVCFAIYMICTFGTSIYGLDLAYIVVGTALAYAVVTAMLGRVSGGQFNPAITVAAILTGKTKVVAGILYVIVQVVGAIAAAGAVRWILPMKTWLTPAVNGYGTGSVSSATTSSASVSFGISMAIVVEVIAAIIIIAVAMRHTDANGKPNATYAPVIGAAYGLGVAMTYTVTGAALNPARATGIALFGQNQGLSTQPLQQLWIFWLAPAIVALVMIIADMASKRKPKTPADAPIDEATDAEADAHDIAVDAAVNAAPQVPSTNPEQ
jgi:aquaporin Z